MVRGERGGGRAVRGVLFVCRANRARSPLAAALAAARFAGRARFASAGTDAVPDAPLSPYTEAVLAERGLAPLAPHTRRAAHVDPSTLHLVVLLHADPDAVRLPPRLAALPRRAWPIPDPLPPGSDDQRRELLLARVRAAADALEARLPELDESLAP
ncbi:MAG TPA: hypothetical protein RMH85_07715 [Polyangiaceae bacterium LLY-WYZ-15_(1-7)]|nr:hypothetical protein [Myxococcales bacterium]MAT28311.1 hypothetical protein [Sandaracinus sp.]HJL05706.1 hypothetical protein [Polyangiaceae bacterium LLY-WYZ-15_(1-7)]MBJ73003.1 hypothetical protein [Sandaracinus sp.]HJL08368.1 hypothetical protein [Polyangiaceae bacterium LLY-WYZ-15_(1-7)]